MVAVASPSYSNADWQLGYESLTTEHSYWIDPIQGEIPAALEGTLFRNGPGILGRGGQPYGHPFDGDGMIAKLTLTQGRAHFANRFVRTPEFIAEQEADRVLYRGVFGTQKPGGWWANFLDLQFKNPANTNVIYHGDKLLALWEASSPYRLDPHTLETLGMESFGGSFRSGQPFTAHPVWDPDSGDLIAFGVDAGINSKLWFYRLNPQGVLVEKTEHPIPGFAFVHDAAWTPPYRIFFQNAVSFNPIPFALGLQPAGTCLDLKTQDPTRILVFDEAGQMISLDGGPGFIFHHVNAFQQDGEIIVDSILYEDLPNIDLGQDYRRVNFDQVPPGQLCRTRFPISSPGSPPQARRQILLQHSVEFPMIHPQWVGKPHRYIYLGATHHSTGNAPLQAIMKFDIQTGDRQLYSFAPHGYVSEPVFIPKPGLSQEDEGWLIVLVFDASDQRSCFAILDAARVEAGPVAQLRLRHHVPYGLHGRFTPQIFLPQA